MTTLITVRGSDRPAGRCDSKCYNAGEGTDCTCVCGGVNHSAGLEKATAATRVLADRWTGQAEFPLSVMHNPLFGLPEAG
jgi:hypothetical protein